MQIKLSTNLLDFFLDVESISNPANINDNNYHFQELLYSTNEYNLKIFLKYRNRFKKQEIYAEITEILNNLNHPCNFDIIDGFILLFCLSKKKYRDYALINKFFSLIQKCKLKQYLFLNIHKTEKLYTLKFKDFYIGSIDYDKFSEFITNHSNSDYAKKYQESLINKGGIEIKNYEVRIVDIYQWSKEILISLDKWGANEMVNCYFTAISNFTYNEFKQKFYKQQEFINAYFGVFLSLEIFETLGVTLVNVFYNFLNSTDAGWVLPFERGLSSIYFPDPRVLEKVNSFVSKNENEVYVSQGEFSRYLDFICSLFSSAEKHILTGNLNHAFVDFFVGLDFLLAPDTEKSKKLKQRISLLTYNIMSLSFTEQLDQLDMLYDARSLYVHQGVSVKVEDLIELRNIARAILSVLLEVHKANLKTKRLTINSWLKKIDDYVQEIYKGKKINQQQLSVIGIKKQKVFFQKELLRHSL